MLVTPPKTTDAAGPRLARALPGLTEPERLVLSNLPAVTRFVRRNTTLAHEAQPLDRLRLFISGWAKRSVGIGPERQQVLGFVLPGDLDGLVADYRQAAPADVVTLTRCETVEFSLFELLHLTQDYPGIGAALRAYLADEAAILGDQVLRLGRMSAYERVIHLMLELFDRQALGAPDGTRVDFPITQSLVADALGLSVVHVNRQVMRLRKEGLVRLDRRSLTVLNFAKLQSLSGYRTRIRERAPDLASARAS
ncbi:MAG: Crp/Fnr family transcriptional regulator [Silicimonas sp.]|nr:Crp/Fnr family transcriptional regulator [Silicimonas sp.]